MESYKVTDSEFLEKYRWSPAEIESVTCFEGGCHERAAYYLGLSTGRDLPDFTVTCRQTSRGLPAS